MDGTGWEVAHARGGRETPGQLVGRRLFQQREQGLVHRAVFGAQDGRIAGTETFGRTDDVLSVARSTVEPVSAARQAGSGRGRAARKERLRRLTVYRGGRATHDRTVAPTARKSIGCHGRR